MTLCGSIDYDTSRIKKIHPHFAPLHFSLDLLPASLSTEAAVCQLQLISTFYTHNDNANMLIFSR